MAADSEDETKRAFREALERKKARSVAGTVHKNGGAKQPGVHGPAANRRNFRRKSG